jgi:hypothetical protein
MSDEREPFEPWLKRQIAACHQQMRAAKHQTKRARFADSALLLAGVLQEFQRRQATEPARTAQMVEAALTNKVMSDVHDEVLIHKRDSAEVAFAAMRAVLVAALATVEPARTCATDWNPIKTAPHGRAVLVVEGSRRQLAQFGGGFYGRGWYVVGTERERCHPTHWCELPPLPAETGASQET